MQDTVIHNTHIIKKKAYYGGKAGSPRNREL